MRFLAVLTWILVSAVSAFARIQVQEVTPPTVDPRTRMIHAPHLAMWDPEIKTNGWLLVSIGGTSSRTFDALPVDETAVAMGYRAIAIDYPNDVISTSCRDSKKNNCFDLFRATVALGESGSDLLQVQPQDSLVYRIESFAAFLGKSDTAAQWRPFLKAGRLDWSKVVLVGHSQGSGHVAFLAKNRRVHASLSIAGPQDTTQNGVASWILKDGATPASGYFFLLHRGDFFGSEGQIAAARALLRRPETEPVDVTHGPPSSDAHVWRSEAPVEDPHNALIRAPEFRGLWSALFRRMALREDLAK